MDAETKRAIKAAKVAGSVMFWIVAIIGGVATVGVLAAKYLGPLVALAMWLLIVFAALWLCALSDLKDQDEKDAA